MMCTMVQAICPTSASETSFQMTDYPFTCIKPEAVRPEVASKLVAIGKLEGVM